MSGNMNPKIQNLGLSSKAWDWLFSRPFDAKMLKLPEIDWLELYSFTLEDGTQLFEFIDKTFSLNGRTVFLTALKDQDDNLILESRYSEAEINQITKGTRNVN
jgi:hypothetical protein